MRPVARPTAGFTLLELSIVCTVLAILAGMGVPQYLSALRTARVGKARHELVTISHAIDAFAANNGGAYPLTLYQVGFGGKRDPWGVPYCYLNYGAGSGDGLDWAIDAGLVDPSAVKTGVDPAPTSTATSGGRSASASSAASSSSSADPMASSIVSAADAEVTNAKLVETFVELATAAPDFKVFTEVPVETTRRRDRYLFPLNTDYDLFSLGPDGATQVALGQNMARDDVIRANNGGYFGVASEY